jgi:hypothetical protein
MKPGISKYTSFLVQEVNDDLITIKTRPKERRPVQRQIGCDNIPSSAEKVLQNSYHHSFTVLLLLKNSYCVVL